MPKSKSILNRDLQPMRFISLKVKVVYLTAYFFF